MTPFYKTIFIACILQCLLIPEAHSATTYDWTGATSSSWTTPGNWKVGGVTQTTNYPGVSSTDIAQIGVSNTISNQPTISGAVSIATLIIGTKTASVTLTINAALSVSGDFTQKNDGSGNGVTTSITGTGSMLCTNFYLGDSTTPPTPILSLANVTAKTTLNFSLSGLTVVQNVVLTTTSSSAVVNIFPSANVNNPIFNLNSGWVSVGNVIQTVDANDVNLSGFTIIVVTYASISSSAQFLMNPTTGNSSILYFNGSNPLSLDGNAGYVDFYGTAGGTSQVNYSASGNQEVYTTSSAYTAAGTRQYAKGLDRSPSVYQNLVFSGTSTKKADAGNLTVGNNFILSVSSTPTADFATNSPIVTVGGTYTANINTILNQGGTGTMSVTGTSSNAGTLNQTGSGNITFTGALTNVATTGVISQTSTGAITASAGFTNAGTYTQGSGSTGGMSVTGALGNSGTITQTAGNITVSGALTNTSTTSTISQTGSGAITASGGVTNSGIISQGSSATGGITITGTFNNIDSLKQTGGAITVNGALTNSGKLILGTANLSISGNYTNSGTYTQSTGTTLFNGSSAETLQDASVAGTNFNNVSFSGAGVKTMSSGAFSVSSTSVLTMIGGSSLAASGNLTLNSDTLGSATVAALSGGAKITGNVSVQRFLSGGSLSRRGYRLMSSPVNQGSGIYSINYLSSSCFLSGTNGTSGGFDKTGNPTIYLFRENIAPMYTTFLNSAFRGINNISTAPLYGMDDTSYPTTNIPVGNGYLFFFRGDRSAASLSAETTATYVPVHATLTATGTLNTDSITVKDWYTPSSPNLGYTSTTGNSSIQGYNLVGNPYASSINWDKFQTSSGSGIYGYQILSTMYVLDEVTKTYGSYIAGSGGVGSQSFVSNLIASGQGFFVMAKCSCATLTFYESAKTTSLPTDAHLLMGIPLITINNQYFRLQLTGRDSTISEQTLIRFKDQASLTYADDVDALYKAGPGAASLSTRSQDNVALCINTIPLPGSDNEVIKLNINTTASGLYTLRLRDLVAVPQLYDVWLMDAYKKDSLDMRQNKAYSFNIDKNDTTSFGSNRFSVIIRQNPAYAYKLRNFEASKVISTNRQVRVNWSAINEGNYTAFTVERSTDGGNTYQILGGVKAAGQGTYSFLDNTPAIGANLYRLKQEDINNTISYSKIVTIQYADLSGEQLGNNINIYPNPASDNISLAIALTSSNSEIYDIKVINTLGLIIQEKTTSGPLWHGNTANLQPGSYILRVFNHDTQNLVGESKFVKL